MPSKPRSLIFFLVLLWPVLLAAHLPLSAKEVIIGSTQPTSTLDPANGYGGWYLVSHGIGETPMRLDDSLRPSPQLAKSWRLVDDLPWELTLVDGAVFHSGRPLTAEAAKKSLERLLEMNSRAALNLKIASIEANGQILTIRTKEPNPTLPNFLCDPYASILDVGEPTTDISVSGTGPFKIRSFKPGEGAVVEKFEGYRGGAPKVDLVTIRYIKDGGAMTLALQAGEIDATLGLPFTSLPLFKDNPAYRITTLATPRLYMIYFNLAREVTGDPDFRKAVAVSIDKEGYAKVLLEGAGTPAIGPFPAFLPYGGDKVEATGYAPGAAAGLLDQAGLVDGDGDGLRERDGKNLDLKLVTYASRAELPVISEALQAALGELGVKVSIEISDAMEEMMGRGEFDLAAYSFNTTPVGDPAAFLSLVASKDGESNWGRFEDPEAQSLIEALLVEFDPARRTELAIKIQRRLLDADAFSFVTHLNQSMVAKSSISGLGGHPCDFYLVGPSLDKAE